MGRHKQIPQHTLYCYTPLSDLTVNGYKIKPCPYLKYRKTNYGYGGKKIKQQYCAYLHKFLEIQDQVKDCEVE